MKIAAFSIENQPGVGIAEGDYLIVMARGAAAEDAIQQLIEGGAEARAEWQRRAEDRSAERLALKDITLAAPIPSRRQTVLCVGKNYHAHANEFFSSGFDSTGKEAVPTHPVIFAKTGSCVVGHRALVNTKLDHTGTVDYEGELAVVIGKTACKVPADKAYDVVFGYTIFNDVTSRELQRRHNQWLIGKSLDTFGPMGPWIVTCDEIGDITRQQLITKVNGEVRQQARIADLVFDIPTLIETITATMTLEPGDIIATGTPAGVGIGFKPPKYLVPGDRVEVEISGIGVLENDFV
jgi:2-keto-4-pentenoate hydratase/2-oxohepta-3-ene-1,7-dioic acid hydratase in catechol pathway